MASIQERAATLLAQGLKPGQVASVIGITPARIAQMSKEENWPIIYGKACEAVGMSATEEAEAELLNTKYKALEAKIIDTIDSTITMMEPRDQIKALDVVAARQEKYAARLQQAKAIAAGHGAAQQAVVVNISIPAHAIPEYSLNERAEIVSIDGKAMAPMSSAAVRTLFSQAKESKDLQQGLQATPALAATAAQSPEVLEAIASQPILESVSPLEDF